MGESRSGSIQGLLDSQDVRVGSGSAHEIDNRCERLVRMLQQNVPFPNNAKNVGVSLECRRYSWRERRIKKIRPGSPCHKRLKAG